LMMMMTVMTMTMTIITTTTMTMSIIRMSRLCENCSRLGWCRSGVRIRAFAVCGRRA
jgi:hypothetical protein